MSLAVLSATDNHVTIAADIVTLRGDRDLVNGLVHCTDATDCTAVTPTDVATNRTASAQALDMLLAEQGRDSAMSNIMQNTVAALVGGSVGKGMVPSQSVKVANALGDDTALDRNELSNKQSSGIVWRKDASTVSATVSPITLDFVGESRAGVPSGVAPAADIRSGTIIAVRSASVGRFGHRADFVRTMAGTVPISQFPIAGSKPADLAIVGVSGVKSYPFKSDGIAP